MPEQAKTGKILRGCRAMWLTFDNTKYTCLGKDSDDLSIDTNPDTETIKNVQGETTFVNNGYTPSMSNEYIARRDDAIYPHIQYIADNLAVDDEHTSATMIVATLDIEVSQTGAKTGTGAGYSVPVKIVVDNEVDPLQVTPSHLQSMRMEAGRKEPCQLQIKCLLLPLGERQPCL